MEKHGHDLFVCVRILFVSMFMKMHRGTKKKNNSGHCKSYYFICYL